MKDHDIVSIQRAIARICSTPEEAYQVVSLLETTDWTRLIQEDKSNRVKYCGRCGKRFLLMELVAIDDYDGKPVNLCPSCHKIAERRCDYCEHLFAVRHDRQYRCFLCRQAYPHVPRQDQCILCQSRYNWNEYHRVSVCESCRKLRGIDERWERTQSVRLSTHEGRARTAGLPANLSLTEWVLTLEDFNWQCAYCRISPYEQLDHFIPISKGGGSLLNNVVPACEQCNKAKGQRHPDDVSDIPQADMERVRSYLQNEFIVIEKNSPQTP